MGLQRCCCYLLACLALNAGYATGAGSGAEISVVDDTGRTLRLAAPARRIVALAPHIVENLFAAGAGAYLVGVTEYSDFPAAAKKLPRLGDFARLDLEAIVALHPDLVIAWASGNPAAYLDKLKTLGLPLFISEPRSLADVAASVERFGQLAATTAVAAPAAQALRRRSDSLRRLYAGRPAVRVFYQLWNQPLATVNGKHLISEVLRLCGGDNVYAGLHQLAPTLDVEAVLAADPEAIIASGMDAARPEWLDMWKRWPALTASARGNLFFVPPDLINRPTGRVVDGAEIVCRHLQTARARRPAQAGSR